MKRIILLFVVALFSTALSAYEIKVKPDYGQNSNDSSGKSYWVKQFDATIKGATYTFSRIEENYGSWEVSIASDPLGTIGFYERSDMTYSWMFDVYGIAFNITFFNKFDPREFKLEVEGHTYYMANLEPDCNSIFDLYGSKEDMESYNADKVLITGSAKTACGRTDWTFTVNNDDLDENVIMAHVFTSVMAVTVGEM